MVLPQALEYNWEFNKSLEQIGESARQRAMLQRKLEQENKEKAFQVYQSVGPAALYPKFHKIVVDQRLGGLQKKLSDYQKQNPNASYIDLQAVANQEVGEIAKQSAGITLAEESIDKYLSLMDPKSPYDKARLRALARNEAFYEEDGTTLRSNFDGFNVDNVISKVIEQNEDKLIDPFKGQQAMKEAVNDASLYTENIEETVETPNGRMTVVKGKKSSVPFFLEVGDNKLRVKQQKDGYIDEGVFQEFYKNPAIRANINAEAKSNMNKLGVPESPEAFEYFKRAYLTTWLENNKKGLFDKVDKRLYEKPSGRSGGSGGSGGGNTFRNAFEEVVNAVRNNSFSDISTSVGDYLVSIANKRGKLAKLKKEYNFKDLNVKEVSPNKFKLYSSIGNEEIATLDERDFNQQYNKKELGTEEARASGVKWKK